MKERSKMKNQVISFNPRYQEKLKQDYSQRHEAVQGMEDRLERYISFYNEIDEMLQENQINNEIKAELSKLLAHLEKVIDLEGRHLINTKSEKTSLLQRLSKFEKQTN